MSLLGNIVSKILHPFGGGGAEAAPSTTGGAGGTSAPSSGGSAGAPAPSGSAGGTVDVEAVLTDLASKNPHSAPRAPCDSAQTSTRRWPTHPPRHR